MCIGKLLAFLDILFLFKWYRIFYVVPPCRIFCPPDHSGVQYLPPPTAGLTLKYISLTRRIRNYTYATPTNTSIPVSVGAVATLFNASPLISEISESKFNEIPSMLVKLPLAEIESSTKGIQARLVVLGHLFFLGPRTPIFDLRPKAYFIGNLSAQIQHQARQERDRMVDQRYHGINLRSPGDVECIRVEEGHQFSCDGHPRLVQRLGFMDK
jgi:hypothetical protein